MEVFAAGAWRTVTRGEIYSGGQWRPLRRAESYITSAWRAVLSFASSLTVSSTDVAGNSYNQLVISDPATATPSGGYSPYTYAWTVLSGGAIANSPSSATTAFQRNVPTGFTSTSVAQVTVTDAAGSTATTTINVSLTHTASYPGDV